MADILPSGSVNVASLTNTSTLNTLKTSVSPKAFGDQLKNPIVSTAIQAIGQSTLARLEIEKANLITEGIQLDVQHQINLQKLILQNTPAKKVVNGQVIDIPPQLSDEEYNIAVVNENKNYEEEKKNIQIRKEQNQKSIDDILKDPFKQQKALIKKLKDSRAKAKTRNKAEKKAASQQKRKAVLQSAVKTLTPTLVLLFSNKLAEIIAQNDVIKKLVDDTNKIIIEANASGDSLKLDNAKLARDNAIRVIQNNEDKIRRISNQINRISTYIRIFSIIVRIISSIPIPTSVPPGIGIPVSLIMKFVRILDKANRILSALSSLLPIIEVTLNKAIAILEDYKAQLLQINGQLEAAAVTNTPFLTSNPSLISNPNQFGTIPETYKGFKFALKQENNPRFVVKGNKRHYAVAIDRDNVEVLKSDFSFTLDPNDLIEQLKLIIDQRNLQG